MKVEERPATRIGDKYPAWVPWAVLAIGTVAASCSAILIRYAVDADPLAISFWRCAAGAAVLAPFARKRLKGVDATATRPALLAGLFLAIHFATWITSIEMTSVAIAVLLVSTAPVFVAIAARFVTNERVNSLGWVGIGMTMAGTIAIGGADFADSSISGSILALIGGATAGWYMLAGQVARRRLGILEYAVITYSSAAVLLLPFCIGTGAELWGYGAQTWWAIAGMIVGPQLLGHTFINSVLSDIDATTVSVTIMAGPVIAMALAYVFFEEVPSAVVYPATVLILAGIYLVSSAPGLRSDRRMKLSPGERGKIDLERCVVMGILNRTPDSFFDGGRMELTAAVEHGLALVDEGAGILDIGAVKAGPGEDVTEDEEIARLIPLVEEIAAKTEVPLSIETGRPAVATRAVEAGAAIVNDVTALMDPELASACAASGAGLILMHNGGQIRGRPRHPRYEDVVDEVNNELEGLAALAIDRGVPPEALALDPGLDFGKNTFHSLELVRRLPELTARGYPVLVAASRKDIVGETLGVPPEERLEGSLAIVALSVAGGAAMVRVHDVEASVRVVRMAEAIEGKSTPIAPVRGLWD